MNRASGTYGIVTEDLTFLSLESWEERGKRMKLKKYSMK